MIIVVVSGIAYGTFTILVVITMIIVTLITSSHVQTLQASLTAIDANIKVVIEYGSTTALIIFITLTNTI